MDGAGQPPSRSRRRHDRMGFRYRVELEFPGGKSMSGITRDVSLNGAFLAPAFIPHGVREGSSGLLHMIVLEQRKTFPFRVVHLGESGIGIEMHNQGENFAMTMSASILQETQVDLGVEVLENDCIRVIRDRQVGCEGRVVKITPGHIEFVFLPAREWGELAAGSRLELTLTQPKCPALPLVGVVRGARGGPIDGEKVCTLRLRDIKEATVDALRERIRMLHGKRLRETPFRAESTTAFSSGADRPSATRSRPS
ncbi:MAG: PilZ domain-containing protein [Magnetococcales bacterium]|nr:PilZ domain-containing protein [Magnetococcales bacterium]